MRATPATELAIITLTINILFLWLFPEGIGVTFSEGRFTANGGGEREGMETGKENGSGASA